METREALRELVDALSPEAWEELPDYIQRQTMLALYPQCAIYRKEFTHAQ